MGFFLSFLTGIVVGGILGLILAGVSGERGLPFVVGNHSALLVRGGAENIGNKAPALNSGVTTTTSSSCIANDGVFRMRKGPVTLLSTNRVAAFVRVTSMASLKGTQT